jgi:hypothetical protein
MYIFNCPEHGEERTALCFRAFNPENKSLWRKVEAVFAPAGFEENELERFLEQIKCSTADPEATFVKIGYGAG